MADKEVLVVASKVKAPSMELKSSISSLFLHAGKDLGFSPNQMP